MTTTQVSGTVATRRQVLVGIGAAGIAAATMSVFAPLARAEFESIDEALKATLGSAVPAEGRIELDVPQIAENGNVVPIGFDIDSPMTADDYVKSAHVFADGNPNPDVASVHFTPACGAAICATRMRLAKTQNIIVIAEMSDGSFYTAKTEVKVTIGGCGG